MSEDNMDPNTCTKAFVPSNQGENPQDLLTQDKNGTTSPLCKVGEEPSPCATEGIDNTQSDKDTPLQDRNEGTDGDTKKDPEGSERAGNEVSSAVQGFQHFSLVANLKEPPIFRHGNDLLEYSQPSAQSLGSYSSTSQAPLSTPYWVGISSFLALAFSLVYRTGLQTSGKRMRPTLHEIASLFPLFALLVGYMLVIWLRVMQPTVKKTRIQKSNSLLVGSVHLHNEIRKVLAAKA